MNNTNATLPPVPTNAYGALAEEVGCCSFCGEVPELDLDWGEGNGFGLSGCCLQAHEAQAHGGYSWADVYGVELADAASNATGHHVSRVVDGGDSLRWALHLASSFWKSRNDVKDFIRAHHSHNPAPPAGDRSRFMVWNGPTLVGVAMLGTPVARMYAKANPDVVEVTRVCVAGVPGLRRNACTKLYAEACAWAKAKGFQKVITFTHADEDATSVKAAGFVPDPEHVYKGGDWGNREGRNYGVQSTKVRWIKLVGKQAKKAAKKAARECAV